MRQLSVALGIAALAGLLGCKRDSSSDENAGFLANASPEASEALSVPVSYELNEDNFAKWETAEQNLDGLPPAEFASVQPSDGSPVDSADARLESSPRAKRAIESAGMTVRDFVLETVALAQAVQASQTGRSTVASGVAAGNFAFVERYRSRIRESGLEGDLARQSGDSAITDANTAAELQAAEADRRADSISQGMDSIASADTGRGGLRPRDSTRDTIPR
jgi:hypothetical protein